MIRNHFFKGLSLLLITLSLGYWFYNTQATHQRIEENRSSVSGEAVSDIKPDDSVNDNDLTYPSRTRASSADAADPDIPRLFGVTITNNDKIAIFQNPLTKSTGTYRIDDSVAGFIVVDIQQYKAILLRGNKKFEVELKNPEDFDTDPLTATSVETSGTFKLPPRPIPPPGKKIQYMESRPESEETTTPEDFDAQKDSGYIHPRFWRKPEHESFEIPLTPTPPIRPTFGDNTGETDTEKEQ